jgi:hypothetical protein
LQFQDREIEKEYRRYQISLYLDSHSTKAAAAVSMLGVSALAVAEITEDCPASTCFNEDIASNQKANVVFWIPLASCIIMMGLMIHVRVLRQWASRGDRWQHLMLAFLAGVFMWRLSYLPLYANFNPPQWQLEDLESGGVIVSPQTSKPAHDAAVLAAIPGHNPAATMDGFVAGNFAIIFYVCVAFLSGLRWQYLLPLQLLFLAVEVITEIQQSLWQFRPLIVADACTSDSCRYYVTKAGIIAAFIEVCIIWVSRQHRIASRTEFVKSKRLDEHHLDYALRVGGGGAGRRSGVLQDNPFRLTNLQRWFASASTSSRHSAGEWKQQAGQALDLEAATVTTTTSSHSSRVGGVEAVVEMSALGPVGLLPQNGALGATASPPPPSLMPVVQLALPRPHSERDGGGRQNRATRGRCNSLRSSIMVFGGCVRDHDGSGSGSESESGSKGETQCHESQAATS